MIEKKHSALFKLIEPILNESKYKLCPKARSYLILALKEQEIEENSSNIFYGDMEK